MFYTCITLVSEDKEMLNKDSNKLTNYKEKINNFLEVGFLYVKEHHNIVHAHVLETTKDL